MAGIQAANFTKNIARAKFFPVTEVRGEATVLTGQSSFMDPLGFLLSSLQLINTQWPFL